MEHVIIDGLKYVKASKIAKDFRYTTDYVGQLCRSGRVDAKLVGRSWYVNPETIHTHKKARYKNKPVEPSQYKNKTTDQPKHEHFSRHITWKQASYETDDAELLPELAKKADEETSVKLSVNPAEASAVKVRGQDQPHQLTPTALPEVSLSGTLKVASLDTYFDPDDEEEVANTAVRPQLRNESGTVSMRRLNISSTTRKLPSKKGTETVLSSSRDNKQKKSFFERLNDIEQEALVKKTNEISRPVHKLAAVGKGDNKSTDNSLQPKVKKPIKLAPVMVEERGKSSFALVNLAIVLSAGVIVLLLGLDSQVVSDDSGSKTSFNFNFANVINLLDPEQFRW